MLHRPLLLAALALAVPLAGCNSYRGVESIHQPVVSRSDYALDVQTTSDGLAPGEPERLRGWLDALRLGYGDTVALDQDGAENGGARADVAAIAGRYGLRLAEAAPIAGAAIAPGTARVTVSRTTAAVTSCTPQSNRGILNFDSHTSGNYGCAVNGNLAAMVANPSDLVRGVADSSGYDNVTGGKAIAASRRAVLTGGGGAAVKSESTGGK
ncbi:MULTISPECIES: CpaD family pilus assembly lipoprotein [unclassified Sphingomonas]|uniref:CpaD family pilus assembly lipoprotein n=1 Tax=unclassified Sphingomonas TaxID=196159 RepID=UPI0016142753|nr:MULTISPECIES: CpaD family pilus assembly lipoprotein [unclassified Sphingomonas]MBB3346837.1 pilus assembly protein CpaD [Sphingomonas sp. BK069]MBB3475621.1 pilus assembly protein CpaD [Sphingomonas sp. BK345]